MRDEALLEKLFREHADYVAQSIWSILGNEADVDDIVQDVFVMAIRKLRYFDNPGQIRAWLRIVAVRAARRYLLGRRIKMVLGLEEQPIYQSLSYADASPEQRDLVKKIYTLLDKMPVGHRLAWTLRHVDGEDLQSVAVLCECSLATAKRRIASVQESIDKELGHE